MAHLRSARITFDDGTSGSVRMLSTTTALVESATRAFLTLTAADDVTSGPPRPIVGFVLVPVPRIAHVQVID